MCHNFKESEISIFAYKNKSDVDSEVEDDPFNKENAVECQNNEKSYRNNKRRSSSIDTDIPRKTSKTSDKKINRSHFDNSVKKQGQKRKNTTKVSEIPNKIPRSSKKKESSSQWSSVTVDT